MNLLKYLFLFQNHIFEWARDHRVHHKFSETDADPHDARRGFFFSHVGWLLCRKHPNVKEKGKVIDLSDLYADSVVMFQKRYGSVFFVFNFPHKHNYFISIFRLSRNLT